MARLTNGDVEARAWDLGHHIRYNKRRSPGALAGSTRTTYLTACSCGVSLGNTNLRREADSRFIAHARSIVEGN